MTKNKQISFEVTRARDESDLSNVFILKCVLVTYVSIQHFMEGQIITKHKASRKCKINII